MLKLASLAAALAAALSLNARAEDPAWGDNPAGFLGSAANFVNGVQFVGWSPQDHPNGGKGTPKYDAYNYLVLNHVDPNDKTWAPKAATALNKAYPCKFWADDGETLMYEDEYIHSAPPGHGDPGGAIPGATGEFIWGGTDGYVKPGNPCGGPSGQVNPPAGSGSSSSTGDSAGSTGSTGTGSGSSDSGSSGSGSGSSGGGNPGLVACAGGVPPVISRPMPAGDEIDPGQITVLGGAAGGAPLWKRGAKLTSLALRADGALIDFTKRTGKDQWPNVLIPGWNGGRLQYTLWMVVKAGGKWVTAGGIEFWAGEGVVNGGNPAEYAHNWYYFEPTLNGHQPAPGEKVGFFLTSGDQRRKDVHEVMERTNIVLVPFPNACGATYLFQ